MIEYPSHNWNVNNIIPIIEISIEILKKAIKPLTDIKLSAIPVIANKNIQISINVISCFIILSYIKVNKEKSV